MHNLLQFLTPRFYVSVSGNAYMRKMHAFAKMGCVFVCVWLADFRTLPFFFFFASLLSVGFLLQAKYSILHHIIAHTILFTLQPTRNTCRACSFVIGLALLRACSCSRNSLGFSLIANNKKRAAPMYQLWIVYKQLCKLFTKVNNVSYGRNQFCL